MYIGTEKEEEEEILRTRRQISITLLGLVSEVAIDLWGYGDQCWRRVVLRLIVPAPSSFMITTANKFCTARDGKILTILTGKYWTSVEWLLHLTCLLCDVPTSQLTHRKRDNVLPGQSNETPTEAEIYVCKTINRKKNLFPHHFIQHKPHMNQTGTEPYVTL